MAGQLMAECIALGVCSAHNCGVRSGNVGRSQGQGRSAAS